MRILVLGADGYLGWPTSLYFSRQGHEVVACDNFAKRQWRAEVGAESVTPIRTLHERVRVWQELTGARIHIAVGDITDWSFMSALIRDLRPEAIVHYGEQHSAPYSMIDRDHAVFTQTNNVMGTLNVLWAMRDHAPDAHLVKLGTMGEYGTPNIDIEEGYLEVEHHGRKDVLPYPKQPGSFYHLCYDDATEVLTKAGWKLFKDVTDQDEIATRQLTDARMVYVRPIALTSYFYEGPMYCLQQRRIDLNVTPNHRMVTSYKQRDGTEAMRFEQAQDIIGKYNRYHLASEWEGEERNEFLLPAYRYLSGGYVPAERPAIEIPMDDWLRFLGWYIAEGTIDRGRRKAPGRINVNQRIGAHSDLVAAAFQQVAASIGCTYNTYAFKDRDQVAHYLFSVQLGVYLAQLGDSLSKHIPRELFDLSKRQLRILFDALMMGDGTYMNRDRHYCRYYTSSIQLADDVQELAIKLGLSANVACVSRSSQSGWVKAPEYRVNISQSTIFQVNQQPDDPNDWMEEYAGMVYCCEVPGDGVILIRRNGKPVWCGNSKVHDSHNMHFACRIWQLRATDLNQGVVYGIRTDETAQDERLCTSFSYDECWGTVLNRFCVQAVMGMPLTVYGQGGQTRGFLDIRDTVQCVALAAAHPADPGELRVFNQFTEQFSVGQLAEVVGKAATELGIAVQIAHVENPRVEKEAHYYNARHTRLLDLGLRPHTLSETLVESIIQAVRRYRDRIDPNLIMPKTRWRTVPGMTRWGDEEMRR